MQCSNNEGGSRKSVLNKKKKTVSLRKIYKKSTMKNNLEIWNFVFKCKRVNWIIISRWRWKSHLEMNRWNQTLKPGETTTSIFSFRISSQTASILIIRCLDVAVHCTVQSVTSKNLKSSSVYPSPSVNFETVLVLSFGLSPGLGSSASPDFQGRFAT